MTPETPTVRPSDALTIAPPKPRPAFRRLVVFGSLVAGAQRMPATTAAAPCAA